MTPRTPAEKAHDLLRPPGAFKRSHLLQSNKIPSLVAKCIFLPDYGLIPE